jgi:hypothetical protein
MRRAIVASSSWSGRIARLSPVRPSRNSMPRGRRMSSTDGRWGTTISGRPSLSRSATSGHASARSGESFRLCSSV